MDHAKHYRAVEKRCAVVLESLHLPISPEHVLEILKKNNFTILEVDIIDIARSCIGVSEYRRGVEQSKAPDIVDCSSFTRWLFGQLGFALPRLAIQQRDIGEPISLFELTKGDLVFTSGPVDFYHDNPDDGVGHVGIATGEDTIIHAASRRKHMVEIPTEQFVGKNKFRGARRYFPTNQTVLTFQVPSHIEIESADDIRYLILRDSSVLSHPPR